MNVKEINDVKKQLELLKSDGSVEAWELPYENLLTRLSAAIFFLTPVKEEIEPQIWKELASHEDFCFQLNHDKKLSQLMYRVTFDKVTKENRMKEFA